MKANHRPNGYFFILFAPESSESSLLWTGSSVTAHDAVARHYGADCIFPFDQYTFVLKHILDIISNTPEPNNEYSWMNELISNGTFSDSPTIFLDSPSNDPFDAEMWQSDSRQHTAWPTNGDGTRVGWSGLADLLQAFNGQFVVM